MLASDKEFLESQKGKSLPHESDKAFIYAEKIEGLLSAVGGAIVTYATAKTLSNGGKKNWFHYTMAIVGGALVLSGATKSGRKKQIQTKKTRH